MVTYNPQLVQQEQLIKNPEDGVPAPIGGWNTRDALSAMSPIDAVVLENWFPDVGKVISRRGYSEHTTGFPSAVETLAELEGTTNKFVAASSDKLYTFTEASGGSPTQIGSGFSNARWQTVNFNNRLLLVNGADSPQNYDGSTLAASSFSGDITTSSTAASMEGVNVFKNRVYYWATDEQQFFYSNTVDTFQGQFDVFPINTVSRTGGTVMDMVTITRDGGSGEDDLMAVILNTGEVILYDGDNPGSASDWQLIGRFSIPRPVGIRGSASWQGDMKIITDTDFSSLLEIIGQEGAITNPSKLSGAVTDAVRDYGDNFGWEAISYPRGNMLFLNVPVTEGSKYEQYVINTITGAACKFTNQNARTFGILNGKLYFGGTGTVFLADDGTNDDGSDIKLSGQPAFYNLNVNDDKKFSSVRHTFRTPVGLDLTLASAVDYATPLVAQATTSSSTGTQWDTSLWDTFQWADEDEAQNVTFALALSGVAISTRFNISVGTDRVEWYRTRYNYVLLNRF